MKKLTLDEQGMNVVSKVLDLLNNPPATLCVICKEPVTDGDYDICELCDEEMQEEYVPLCEHCSANVIQGLLCHEHGCPAKYLSERGQISILYMSIVAILTGIIAGQSVIFNCLDKLINVIR